MAVWRHARAVAALLLLAAQPPPTAAEAVDPLCALNGFWAIDTNTVARFWKAPVDLGSFQFVGRGQCADASGRGYAGWSASAGVAMGDCKGTCDADKLCVAFEVADVGSCYLRYSAGAVPKDPPRPALSRWGGDRAGAGPPGRVMQPNDRYCYSRLDDTTSQASGQRWRVMFFPKTAAVFASDTKRTKEAQLAVDTVRPPDFPDCTNAGVTSDAAGPFASGLKVYWGLRESNFWTGLPKVQSASRSWLPTPDIAAWDPTATTLDADCPVAQDLTALSGQLSWVHHALSGVGNCGAQSFPRLTPDTAELGEAGLKQVITEAFRYGLEVYTRRLLMARSKAVADEACFNTLMDSFWNGRKVLTYTTLQAQLDSSACMNLVPVL